MFNVLRYLYSYSVRADEREGAKSSGPGHWSLSVRVLCKIINFPLYKSAVELDFASFDVSASGHS